MESKGRVYNHIRWALFIICLLGLLLSGNHPILAQGDDYGDYPVGDLSGKAREIREIGESGETRGNHKNASGQRLPLSALLPIHSLDAVKEGSLLFRTGQERAYVSAPTLKTDVQIMVTGLIVRATVRQWFSNPTDSWLEGIYVFPLPETAAVDYLKMTYGNRIIEGEVKERQQARHEYEQARQSGRKASLLEQERANIFTTSVANIAPGEEIEITITYQHTALYDHGTFSLRFPMVVAPRYIPGTERIAGEAVSGWAYNTTVVPDAERITPPVIAPGSDRANLISITIDLEAGFPVSSVSSRYHEVDTEKIDQDVYTISLRDGAVKANRDFVLEWKPEAGREPRAALFTEELDDGIYSLLMIMPPDPGYARTDRLPRECVFIIDTSGSMHGESLSQAKTSLLLALENLSADDSFNIIQFNSRFEMLYPQSRPASDFNREEARWFVQNLESQGGTEMLPALQAALQDDQVSQGLRQVIFITDGSVGNEDQLCLFIKNNLHRSRLFTVGIGSAPNSFFMAKAAQYGRGTFTHIGKTSEVEDKMKELFQKLETPVMTDIAVVWNDPDVDFYPALLPDLYLGQPVMVTARLFHLSGDVAVSGNCRSEPWRVNFALRSGREEGGISKIWARNRIAGLMDIYRDNGKSEETRQEIISLAIQYSLASQFTSFVAVDKTPVRPDSEALQSAAVPAHLPEGWNAGHVPGSLPQTDTPMTLLLIIGLVCLGGAYVIHHFNVRGNEL